MTGSNASTRFDVASILSSYGTSGPILDTNTLYFSGAFYAQHIGWVVFASGSTHQVRLNCGGQDIKNLTLKCTF
jgi:hypothetical protein